MQVLAVVTFLASFFVSSMALACPNLAGRYTVCRSTTGSTPGSVDTEVSQVVSNGITTYRVSYIDEETNDRVVMSIVADGRAVKHSEIDPETGILFENEITSSCVGPNLLVNTKMSVNHQLVGTSKMKVSKNGMTLTQDVELNYGGNKVTDRILCE